MSVIDYSKWDKIDSDADDELAGFSNTPPASAMGPVEASSHNDVVAASAGDKSDEKQVPLVVIRCEDVHAHPPTMAALRSSSHHVAADLGEEDAELAHFVRQHPCPPLEAVMRWLRDATENGNLEAGPRRLSDLLDETVGIVARRSDALDMFSYTHFKQLYEAPLLSRDDRIRSEKQVGIALNRRGGMSCMRLHYYMINYAMCGPIFFGNKYRPSSVCLYISHVNSVWDNIGEWRH